MVRDWVHLGALLGVLLGGFLTYRWWRGSRTASESIPAISIVALRSEESSTHGRDPLPAIREPRVVIRKSLRRLDLLDGNTGVRSYPIALGVHPVGDKEREGDGRTPEGTLYVCTRNDRSRFHLFLGLSYPSLAQAHRGLSEGLIDGAQYEAVRKAHGARDCPPWNTPLGGAVGIHGGGVHGDWTVGCIALANEHIEELWSVLRLGDPVQIVP